MDLVVARGRRTHLRAQRARFKALLAETIAIGMTLEAYSDRRSRAKLASGRESCPGHPFDVTPRTGTPESEPALLDLNPVAVAETDYVIEWE